MYLDGDYLYVVKIFYSFLIVSEKENFEFKYVFYFWIS